MADRLTQLQDAVNAQAENFCNSIGVLQQFATPSSFPEFEKSPKSQQQQEDYAHLFATLIARTAKDIDVLIDSLPSEDSSPELQIIENKSSFKTGQELCHVCDTEIRKRPYKSENFAILCAICSSSFHLKCVGISHDENETLRQTGQKWKCSDCLAARRRSGPSGLLSDVPPLSEAILDGPIIDRAASLRRLEQENQDSARRLEEVVRRGDILLNQIQQALHDIAESQLEIQRLQDSLS